MHKAELYSSSQGLQKRDAAESLSHYLSLMKWKPGDKVIDVGCGPGFVTAHELLPRLPHDFGLLVGTDVSHAMVDHASNTYIHPKLKFSQLDISAEDINTEIWHPGFDKAFSFYCLHWIPEQRRAVENIYRLLKTGGEALIVLMATCPLFNVYNSQCKKPKWIEYMKDAHRYISPYHQSPDPKDDFTRLLLDVGFQVIECECKENIFKYNTVDCLKDAIKAVNPFLDRIPEELQEEYLSDCVEEAEKIRCAETNNNEDKVTAVRYDLIVAYARK